MQESTLSGCPHAPDTGHICMYIPSNGEDGDCCVDSCCGSHKKRKEGRKEGRKEVDKTHCGCSFSTTTGSLIHCHGMIRDDTFHN